MAKANTTKKRSAKPAKNQPSKLENIYRQYLAPMPLEEWAHITNLSQPTTLKRVPTRTAYSSVE
jgi:hypothetical protein